MRCCTELCVLNRTSRQDSVPADKGQKRPTIMMAKATYYMRCCTELLDRTQCLRTNEKREGGGEGLDWTCCAHERTRFCRLRGRNEKTGLVKWTVSVRSLPEQACVFSLVWSCHQFSLLQFGLVQSCQQFSHLNSLVNQVKDVNKNIFCFCKNK